MKATIWIDWDCQDLCSNEAQLKDAYDDSDCALAFEDFLGNYCRSWDWTAVWERFDNNAERDKILKEFEKASKEDFWTWVKDHYEEVEITV